MKTIVVIMAVALALVGAAAAWEETNTLSYNFKKVIDTQAGEHPEWFTGSTSQASFTQPTGPFSTSPGSADASATVKNTLTGLVINAPITPAVSTKINGQTVDTEDVLTQYGSAKVFEESPNTQKPAEDIYTASATAGENIALSGLYTNTQAQFANVANVHVQDYTATTAPEAFGHLNQVSIEGEPAGDHGSIGGTVFSEANMGSEATVGVNELQAAGALATMSGSFTQWGNFAGAYNSIDPTTMPASVDIDTAPHASSEQQFDLNHS